LDAVYNYHITSTLFYRIVFAGYFTLFMASHGLSMALLWLYYDLVMGTPGQ
jgi:hypothetical protein